MQNHSQIVIGPDGTVLAVSGQLPPGLIDTRLEDCVSLAPAIRAAGTTLLRELRASGNRVASQTIDLDGAEGPMRDGGSGHAQGSVQIVAIEALAIRRTAT